MLSKLPTTELQLKSHLIKRNLWGMCRGYCAYTGKELWDCPRSRAKWEKRKDCVCSWLWCYTASVLTAADIYEIFYCVSPLGDVYRNRSDGHIIASVAGRWKPRAPPRPTLSSLLEHSISTLQAPSGCGEQPSSCDYTASHRLPLGQSERRLFLNYLAHGIGQVLQSLL